MDVPVVAAAALEGHVEERELAVLHIRQRVQKAAADKILCKPVIRGAGPEHVCLFK